MSKTVSIPVPDALLIGTEDLFALEKRSRLLLALKFFELGELSSGQAAEMCGLSRVSFLLEAGRQKIPVADLDENEIIEEFS